MGRRGDGEGSITRHKNAGSAVEHAVERPGDLLSVCARSEQQGEEEARLGAVKYPRAERVHSWSGAAPARSEHTRVT